MGFLIDHWSIIGDIIKQDVFSILPIYIESLGDTTINDQEIISEISGLFLLQLSDFLMPGYTMSLSATSERENGACTFLGVIIHSTDKPQPTALHAYCHGVPAERVVSRINPRTEITMDILDVQFIALISLFIRFTKFNEQWNFTTKHYGLFCNTLLFH